MKYLTIHEAANHPAWVEWVEHSQTMSHHLSMAGLVEQTEWENTLATLERERQSLQLRALTSDEKGPIRAQLECACKTMLDVDQRRAAMAASNSFWRKPVFVSI